MIDQKSKYAFGICSNTEDNKHIIMLDFDNIELDVVYNTIISMQKKFNLSDFYLLSSTNGYNAFCLSKRKLKEVEKMLKQYKSIDKVFIRLAITLRGFFVLRMGKDKKLIDIIENDNLEKLSNAHKIFFTEIMDFNINEKLNYDKSTKFKVIAFRSKKHGLVHL